MNELNYSTWETHDLKSLLDEITEIYKDRLANLVIEQIKQDIQNGDWTAIHQLLMDAELVSIQYLEGYLPEQED